MTERSVLLGKGIGEPIRWGRCISLIVAILLGIFVSVLGGWIVVKGAAFAGFPHCNRILEWWLPPLGFLALGSIAAFFTSYLNALKVVKYNRNRSARRRFLLCLQRTSRLETLIHIFIGLAVGGGAFLFARLTGA